MCENVNVVVFKFLFYGQNYVVIQPKSRHLLSNHAFKYKVVGKDFFVRNGKLS